nr:MAG TPA: hypothetical protein [Caudoviricetes sp.]
MTKLCNMHEIKETLISQLTIEVSLIMISP